ncbi:hypothetical protein SAMN05660472_02219 [Natronincola ferrireducens]|uniref:Uncharacterized protein n=1 Tax=Natronincola ferrireducens TaxID=393762 RepID=A0A1G9FR30_9FIRM|nr:hypothetical protein SAMN05660472_02219 [Natronincola ferrireducens]
MGCESIKDTNSILGPEILADNMLDMEQFLDQSQINLVLKPMNKDGVDQLQDIHYQLYINQSYSLSYIGYKNTPDRNLWHFIITSIII